jgi:hypothetical protein
MPMMKESPEWLRATFASEGATVDQKQKVLRGMVVAQLGPFKSQGRGRFDKQSLEEIVALGNRAADGLKSRFTHPDMSNDGLGKFLGRVRDLRMSTALDARTGNVVPAVRGDLHFNQTALDTPPNGGKPLGVYVMELAGSDPNAISSSIVVKPALFVEDSKGKLVELAPDEDPPPGVTPLWRPRELHASDIVDTGDAVDGLLSAQLDVDGLPLSALWKGEQLLDSVFAGQDRAAIESRLHAYVGRYLDRKFPTPRLNSLQERLDEMQAKVVK